MKKITNLLALLVMLSALIPCTVRARELLVPGGSLIGLHISDDTVTVAAFDDALGAAARKAGLMVGDELVEIEGRAIHTTAEIPEILAENPDSVSLTVSRGNKRRQLELMPQATPAGPKLGVYLRQGVSGIGTVTWYDPDSGHFGTLGHGVSARKGILTPMAEGNAYPARITDIVPGRAGQPGFLKGIADPEDPCGTLLRNTPQGVFGSSKTGWPGEPLPAADFQEVHTGSASIRSTVTGSTPQEYSVEILKIYPPDREDCRNFLLRVTDSTLLTATGGIVQGMSGSPIIQDGRLVGAVTHVMVSDPTTGYGIFIGNMLDAAA